MPSKEAFRKPYQQTNESCLLHYITLPGCLWFEMMSNWTKSKWLTDMVPTTRDMYAVGYPLGPYLSYVKVVAYHSVHYTDVKASWSDYIHLSATSCRSQIQSTHISSL